MKDFAFKLLYVVAFAVAVFNLIVMVKNGAFFNIEELPKGELMYSVDCPDGQKTLNVYLVKNNLGAAVRGEISDGSGKPYNVFWQTDTDDVDSFWIDNDYIAINEVVLNVNEYFYDSRRGTSIFQEGSVDGKAAENYKNRVLFE